MEQRKSKEANARRRAMQVLYYCFTAALFLLYYCFTNALLLLYCCFTTAGGEAARACKRSQQRLLLTKPTKPPTSAN